MTEYETIATRYLDTWNETDPVARRAALAALWAADGIYSDPLAEARGPEQIDAVIAGVQDQFPGFTFRLTGPVDGHHDQCRFTWELGAEGLPAPVVGTDVAVLDGEGNLGWVLGFLDQVPAA